MDGFLSSKCGVIYIYIYWYDISIQKPIHRPQFV